MKQFNRNLSSFHSPIKRKAVEALKEDAQRDNTSEAVVLKSQNGTASIIANETGVFCGLLEAKAVFGKLKVAAHIREGNKFQKGQELLTVSGSLREILRCERTALNYISLLSGIATATGRFQRGRAASLRKTHPLLNLSERRAVQVGGGITHRLNLGDGVLVKDNHITAIAKERKCTRETAIWHSVATLKNNGKTRNLLIEIEAATVSESVAAAQAGADAILLDNFSPAEGEKAAKAARSINSKIIIEASGGITSRNASLYLKFADFVSSSEVAMRARPIDVSLEVL